MIKQRQVTLYSLFCDNCGRRFEGNDYDEFFDSDDMLDEAADDAGWCGLYNGEKEPEKGKDHLSWAEQHFCCLACELEFLGKLALKTFRPVSGGDAGGGSLSARDVGSASEFHDAAGGGTPQPGGNSAMK